MKRIADELVSHARFVSAREAIFQALERADLGDPQILPMVGPTRVGKTRMLYQAIKDIVNSHPNGLESVVFVASPKHLTGRALPDACLGSIGLNASFFANHVAATSAFVKAINKKGTRLIIFDETQHMLERGSSTTVRAAADFLKALFDQTQASIVLAGLPSLRGLFDANEQLADRARRAFEFYPYECRGGDYKQFRAALAAALEHLTDSGWHTFEVKDAEFAQRMYIASAGRFGLISKIFMEVQSSAPIGEALYPAFAKAYDDAVMNRLIEYNPFHLSRPVQTENMARVYASIMEEAGVRI